MDLRATGRSPRQECQMIEALFTVMVIAGALALLALLADWLLQRIFKDRRRKYL